LIPPVLLINNDYEEAKLSMKFSIQDSFKKARNSEPLWNDEITGMLELSPQAAQTYEIMAVALEISEKLSSARAEVHAQFAVNCAPCVCGCLFCSFAAVNNIFTQSTRLTIEEAAATGLQFEADGANAIFVMATAHFPMSDYLDIARELRRNLRPHTRMIANVGDQNEKTALLLADAGFCGVYHAVRLGEGIDTKIDPQKRLDSIHAFQEVGLRVGTCVEPIGPEHSNQELADAILRAASFNPAYSGAARRIAIPGTEMAKRGMISELRMAQIVAVTRLATQHTVTGNCTHEPCTLGALAGANLFWAEAGANPRDTAEHTEKGRGHTVQDCRKIFNETDWKVLEGPSEFYKRA
jgi:biotin synthase